MKTRVKQKILQGSAASSLIKTNVENEHPYGTAPFIRFKE
jgi:hypothetical protein